MSNILQIGYTVEGVTDKRFFSNIIRKTFEHAVFNCSSDIEVYEPEPLEKHGEGFIEQIKNITRDFSYFHVICIHCDSDDPSPQNVLNYKINPAIDAVRNIEDACKNLVPIIPVQMTEAWMLADYNLLKTKIGTTKTNLELNLPRKNRIEAIPNPKQLISDIIRISQSETSRRRRSLSLSNLYSPISQELSIDNLLELNSFNNFYANVLNSLTYLNYLS